MSRVKHDGEYYGYGLALGGSETSLLALTNAYRALANGGLWSPAHLQIERGVGAGGEAIRVLSAEASFIVSDMLADSAARASTFGLASPLSTRSWAAVKTGLARACATTGHRLHRSIHRLVCGSAISPELRCGTCRVLPVPLRSG